MPKPRTPPPVPDFSKMTAPEMWAAGWPRCRFRWDKDPYRSMRPHPNALAFRRINEEDEALLKQNLPRWPERRFWMNHPATKRFYARLPGYYEEIHQVIDFGLNPFDVDWYEFAELKAAKAEQLKAENDARRAREAAAREEALRRNPPPPCKHYRVIGTQPKHRYGKLALHRAAKLKLYADYGGNWKPHQDERGVVPRLQPYWKDAIDGHEVPKPKRAPMNRS